MADIGKKDKFHLIYFLQLLFFDAFQLNSVFIVGPEATNFTHQIEESDKSGGVEKHSPTGSPPGWQHSNTKPRRLLIPHSVAIGCLHQKSVVPCRQVGVVRQSLRGIAVIPVGVESVQFPGEVVLFRTGEVQSRELYTDNIVAVSKYELIQGRKVLFQLKPFRSGNSGKNSAIEQPESGQYGSRFVRIRFYL